VQPFGRGAFEIDGTDGTMTVVEKRYQVFLSSTYADLTEERAAVIQAILDIGHLPAGMEMFPAANEDQMTLIKQVIDESDYYVVVVAGRYGSVDAQGVSYTEQEYDYAVESGIPILGFVHGDPDKIEQGKTDQNDKARKRLAEFRKKVEQRMVKHFTSSAELGGHVTTSLMRAIRTSPRVGWVRGDKAMTVEIEREILDLRQQLAKAEDERESAQQALIEDSSGLAQGNDSVTIPLIVKGWDPEKSARRSVNLTATTTWDALFGDVGPIMVDEALDQDVRQRVASHLGGADISRDDRLKVKGWQDLKLSVYNDDWDMIQVQFRALGLIDKGQKKRTVTDTRKWLSLTEKATGTSPSCALSGVKTLRRRTTKKIDNIGRWRSRDRFRQRVRYSLVGYPIGVNRHCHLGARMA